MSSTEPPSRVPPRGHTSNDAKTAQDRAEAKKIEKIREVEDIDADERTRKKFRAMMGDSIDDEGNTKAPNPFDTVFKEKQTKGISESKEPSLGASRPSASSPSNEDSSEDDTIPTSDYADSQMAPSSSEWEEEPPINLPQSNQFWKSVDSPDNPAQQPQMEENPPRQKIFDESPSKRPAEAQKETQKGKKGSEPHLAGQTEFPALKKGEEPHKGATPHNKGAKEKVPSLLNIAAKETIKSKTPEEKAPPPVKKGEEKPLAAGIDKETAPLKKTHHKDKKDPTVSTVSRDPDIAPLPSFHDKDSDGKGHEGQKQVTEISSTQPLTLPPSIQPVAQAATTAATPYLHPSTIPLFTQMVGTMYVMAAPPGISRTEIVLNSPAFANSKFFGATITIEKYSTAPDSFNIRLTGSDAAIVSFRDNIPSLMAAFQNSNLPFRVHRVDAEYSAEKPVFRRKEGGEGRGDSGGGDLGERRNK